MGCAGLAGRLGVPVLVLVVLVVVGLVTVLSRFIVIGLVDDLAGVLGLALFRHLGSHAGLGGLVGLSFRLGSVDLRRGSRRGGGSGCRVGAAGAAAGRGRHRLAADQLDDRHRRVVALARADLGDAGVAAVALG